MICINEPKLSPWGAVQNCEIMNTGIYSVDTASHGGIMIEAEYARKFSRRKPESAVSEKKAILILRRTVPPLLLKENFLIKKYGKYPIMSMIKLTMKTV